MSHRFHFLDAGDEHHRRQAAAGADRSPLLYRQPAELRYVLTPVEPFSRTGRRHSVQRLVYSRHKLSYVSWPTSSPRRWCWPMRSAGSVVFRPAAAGDAKRSTVPWRSPSPTAGVQPHRRTAGVPLYPTQLTEAFLTCYFRVFNLALSPPSLPRQVFAAYLFIYSLLRFVMEYFRGDPDRGYLIGSLDHPLTSLSTSQTISLVGLVAAPLLYRLFCKQSDKRIKYRAGRLPPARSFPGRRAGRSLARRVEN